MSSKTTKKTANSAPKVPEPVITRTKSAHQRRQLRIKPKKTEKAILNTQEIKSPKLVKSPIRPKESLVKSPVKTSPKVTEQVEYHPNKLKRDISTKKIMLKPKHNFKVIAATNKRKLATPQKGIKSPLPSKKQKNMRVTKSRKYNIVKSCSPELSMQDMVRIMEESRSLSDEDFMEILTCPSPVWWEDPPDGGYDEDAICTRFLQSPENTDKDTKKHKIESSDSVKINTNNISHTEHKTQVQQSRGTVITKDERFVKKKLKLENVLGNIKKKVCTKTPGEIKSTDSSKNKFKNELDRSRNLSESDVSDLSFNEEEILKTLENMDIPIEGSEKNTNNHTKNTIVPDKIRIKEEIVEKNDKKIIKTEKEEDFQKVPPLSVKSEIKDEIAKERSVFDVDSIPMKIESDVISGETSSNTEKKSDEIFVVDSCTNSTLGNKDEIKSLLDLDTSSNSEIVTITSKEQNNSLTKDANNSSSFFPNKKLKDLSEYITIYKIIPEKHKLEKIPDKDTKPSESVPKSKLDTVRGKLNDFFKQSKYTKRLKKSETPIPAVSAVTAVKESIDNEKENDKKIDSDSENRLDSTRDRLKSCEYCIEKTENGTTYFSCDKCEQEPILPCNLCNFLADTKEVYRKHVSTCKDVARISWSHNYVLNQT